MITDVYREGWIKGGLQFTGVHAKIAEWVESHPRVYFIKTTAVSWIDGVSYYHKIIFLDEEDYLIFKLTFSEAIA